MWIWLLKNVMNYMVGKNIFGKIQGLVADVALNDKLSGSEKKDKVITELKSIETDFKKDMINLAIEAAVVLLKEKTNTIK